MIRDGLTIAISLRPRSTLEPTLGRARIPTIRLTPRTLASCACALTGAVDLTSVAGSTDEGHCATPSAQKASKRFGHRRSSDNRRTHRHTSTSVLCSQHARTRWAGRGHGIGSTATFKPMPCLFSRLFQNSGGSFGLTCLSQLAWTETQVSLARRSGCCPFFSYSVSVCLPPPQCCGSGEIRRFHRSHSLLKACS